MDRHGTTHADGNPDNLYIKAVYIAFGEALGFMEVPPNSGNYILMDVHGAGAQRSDPKFGDPEDFPYGFGPQGDVIRIFNFVRLVRGGSVSEVENERSSLPGNYNLEQNYPNPFNPETTIKFTIPNPLQRKAVNPAQTESRIRSNFITLKIYDTLGKEVTTLVNEEKTPGTYEIKWNAKNLSRGIYFYQLKTNSSIKTKKMLLLR